MPQLFTREMEVALRCIAAAAGVCQRTLEEHGARDAAAKEDKSPVTVADYGSQAVICRILRESFPEDRIVAEETSEELRRARRGKLLADTTGMVRAVFPDAAEADVCRWVDYGTRQTAARYWCLDPIDGTKGFLRGDQYAVALALVIGGEVQIGVLACPNLPLDLSRPGSDRGVIFHAIKGMGARQMPLSGSGSEPIRVAPPGSAGGARFCESYEPAHSDQEAHGRIAARLGITEPPLRMDSQAKYGLVARGDASVYLRLPSPGSPGYREKVWDHAAGSILVEEAGGRVTDMHGRPLDFGAGHRLENNAGVIATNGHLHDRVLKALHSGEVGG